MDLQQHMKLARYYKNRYGEMAAYSRSVHGKLTRQQAQDYADMWKKYLDHKHCSSTDYPFVNKHD